MHSLLVIRCELQLPFFIYDNSNGCIVEDAFSLIINETPGLDMEILSAIQCAGEQSGEIALNLTGAGPFTIDWNTDSLDGETLAANLSAGFYEVNAYSAPECFTAANLIVPEPTALSLNCVVSQQVTTIGGNDGVATLNISGGVEPYNLNWSGPNSGNRSGSRRRSDKPIRFRSR